MIAATCAAALLTTAGLAGTANATPTPLASKHDHLVTDDGWNIDLRASELVVNPMSNVANSFASREGWVSSRVKGTITGAGREDVQSAILEQVLIIGCQVDVSDGATLGLATSIGPNASVNISGVPSASIGGSASVAPSISSKLAPGKISEFSLGKKTLQTDHASIRAKKIRVSVDGCVGPTTVRLLARFSVSTKTSDDTTTVYSARMWL
ncbi:MspA family porin [Gordonia sp. CPCC 205333]|uniref:MspA family porin n=1 Tax=Gordonia sp. CPCC 205333 TaxID=3140790 RepID=UPI003AF33CDB